jgi:hypothetical protein
MVAALSITFFAFQNLNISGNLIETEFEKRSCFNEKQIRRRKTQKKCLVTGPFNIQISPYFE